MNIAQVTAPLVLKFADGREKVVDRCFPHPLGLVYLDLFWPLKTPDEAAHLIRGKLEGDGPWRIAKTTIRVLGCAQTDPHLQDQYLPWRDYMQQNPYPSKEQIQAIARRLGCLIDP